MQPILKYSSIRPLAHIIVCAVTSYVFLSASISVVIAGPEDAQVIHGQVSFQQNGLNTVVTASDNSIVNYSSFDIARPEVVQFVQPGSNASVLNRILSANPTHIDGTLLANGRVFFVNPAGIFFGNGARINVNQLVASALNISNSDFLNGKNNFVGGNGSVINHGDISAEKVYLIGKQVANTGNISCPAGYVVMAAGDSVFLSEPGSDVMVEIDPQTLSEPTDPADSGPGVLNQGNIDVAGGKIVLAAGDIYSQAISNVGSLSASVEIDNAGQIKLAAAGGQVSNTGSIEATSDTAKGGTVIAEGTEVTNSGTVDVTGSEGGQIAMEASGRLGQFGTIHADGTGANGGSVTLRGDDVAALSSDSLTTANAGTNGDGGKVTVSSPGSALFRPDAKIEAKGGSESGDGGVAEVSGKGHVEVYGLVDTSAPCGKAGTFRIDPTDVTLSDVTVNMDNSPKWDPVTPDQDTGTINVASIAAALQNGTSVSVETFDDNGGNGTGRIIVNSPIGVDLTTTGAESVEAPTLTLNAQDDIDINAQISVTLTDNSDDQLNLTLKATNGVDIGASINTDGGSFNSSSTTFDNTGGEITAGNVDIDATGQFTCQPGSRIAAGGDGTHLNINAVDITLNPYGVSNETLTNTGTGTITLTASGDTFLAEHSINIEKGALKIDSANITLSLPEFVSSASQRAKDNRNIDSANIKAIAGTGSEIEADGYVSLTAAAIGSGTNRLDLDGAVALEITDIDTGDIWIGENRNTIKSTTITVDNDNCGRIDIAYAQNDKINIYNGHQIFDVDIGNHSDSAFSYTAKSGDIILGAVEYPISMGSNGDVTLSTPDDIIFPDWWGEGPYPLIITDGGLVSLTADAIYGYTYNGSPQSVPLGIQGATSLTLTDAGPGPMWLAEVGGSTFSSTAITVGNIDYGTIDIIYDNERGSVDIDDDHFINSVVQPFSFSYTATKGDISIGSIEVNLELLSDIDINLKAAKLPLPAKSGQNIVNKNKDEVGVELASAGGGDIVIIAGGAIRDAVDDSKDPAVDLVGGTISLTAGSGGIGTPVSVGEGDARIVQDRVLEITAGTELNADTTADGADILINSIGDLPIGLVNAKKDAETVGDVVLMAKGGVSHSNRITADKLTVDTSSAFAGAGAVILDVVANEASTIHMTSGNDQDIKYRDADGVDIELANAGTGNVTIIANGAVTDSGAITAGTLTVNTSGITSGAITLDLDATHDVDKVNLTSKRGRGGQDIVFKDKDDLDIELVNASTGNVTIIANGAVTDSGAITAGTLTINTSGGTDGEIKLDLDATHDVDKINLISKRGRSGQDIIFKDKDDVDIELVNAGTGNVTINAGGAIRDDVDDSGDASVDVVGGTINLTAGTGGIGTSVSVWEDDVLVIKDRVLEISAGIELNADTTAALDEVILINSIVGYLPVGLIDASEGLVILNSNGTITEAVDGHEATDIKAEFILLNAATGVTGNPSIETSAERIRATSSVGDIHISNYSNGCDFWPAVTDGPGSIRFSQTGGGSLLVSEATTHDGSIHISVDNASLMAGTVVAGGDDVDDNVELTTTRMGNVLVDNVTALGNTITINSDGSIWEFVGNDSGAILVESDPGTDLTAETLLLTAGADIGSPDGIETSATMIEAKTTNQAGASSDIVLNNNNAADTFLIASTFGEVSSVIFDQTGGGQLTLTDVLTADGNISITDDLGGIIATNVSAGGNHDVSLTTTTSGDVIVDSVTAFDNTVTINSGGAIKESASDDDADIVGGTVNLIAEAGGIGPVVVTAITELNADTTADGADILIDSVGDLPVGFLTANDGVGTVGDVTLNSTGAINDASDDSTVDITADVLTLTAQNEIGGNPTAGKNVDTLGAVETDVTSLKAHSIMGDIVIVETDDVELQNILADAGSIVLQATNGAMTDGRIAAGGGSLIMKQAGGFDLRDFTFGNQENTDLTLQSFNGSIKAVNTANGGKDENAADKWKSIKATAKDNINLRGTDNIKIGGDLISTSGGVSIISDNGAIYSSGAPSAKDYLLDVAITGYSDDTGRVTTGVALPYGSGKAAIVIKSQDNLKLGSRASLRAKGTYVAGYATHGTGVDDRPGVGFKSTGEDSGNPIDVAIYVGSSELEDIKASWEWKKEGNVTVDSAVSIDSGGTIVIDAENTVNAFGRNFVESWKSSDGTNRLEVVSRITQTLDQAVYFRTLPHAEEARRGKEPHWFKGLSLPWFGSKYVLRGKRVAEVLGNIEPAPLELRALKPPEEVVPAELGRVLPILIFRAGESLRPQPNMILQHGDEITTLAGMTAFIEFQEGSEIIMKPQTRIQIESPGVFAWFGEIIASIREKFEVKNKYVTTAVEGTKFIMRVGEDGETIVKMVLGRIVLTSNDNRWPPVSLGPGEQARIWMGQRPQIEPISQQEYRHIINSIITLQRHRGEKPKVPEEAEALLAFKFGHLDEP